MAIIQLYPAKKQKKEPEAGAEVPERFIGNMPLKLSNCFELVGGAWVMPRAREQDEDITGMVGIAQTHEKLRLVSKITGRVMKI